MWEASPREEGVWSRGGSWGECILKSLLVLCRGPGSCGEVLHKARRRLRSSDAASGWEETISLAVPWGLEVRLSDGWMSEGQELREVLPWPATLVPL